MPPRPKSLPSTPLPPSFEGNDEGRIGRYVVLRRLGEGASGEVFLGYDESLKRYVGIKVLSSHLCGDKGNVERFLHEARAVAAINHPNVIAIHELAEWGGRPYFAMEYVEGGTLDALLEAKGRLSPREALEILRQMALGLQAALAAHLIHRDVKPSNVLVKPNGEVKVMDFGLAKVMGMGASQTFAGAIMGTPHYISPEQARGEGLVDHRSDIYSLGVTFFHMLTGRVPFEAQTPMGVLLRHIDDSPPRLGLLRPDLPIALEGLVNAMLAKAPKDRPQDYDDLLRRIELSQSCLDTRPMTERPGPARKGSPPFGLATSVSPPRPRSAPLFDWARVLVVDDSAMSRKLLGLMLDGTPFPHLSTGESLMVTGFLRHQGARIVLLDINMPERDGWEVLTEIHRLEEELGRPFPVILVSSQVDERVRARAAERGVFAILEKPLHPDELLATLARAARSLQG